MSRLFRVKTVAEYLGVEKRTVFNIARRNNLELLKIGSQYRVPEETARKLLSLDESATMPIPDVRQERENKENQDDEADD